MKTIHYSKSSYQKNKSYYKQNIKNKPIEQIKKPKNTRKMKNYQNIQKEKLYNCDWKKKEDGDDQEEFFAC